MVSKSDYPSKLTGGVTVISLETLQPKISRLFKGPGAVFTAEELAKVFGRDARTIYHYGTGQVRLTISQFATLVLESAKRGNRELLDALTPQPNGVATNGDVDDELGELTQDLGDARKAFKRGEFRTAKRFAGEVKQDAVALEQEILEAEA